MDDQQTTQADATPAPADDGDFDSAFAEFAGATQPEAEAAPSDKDREPAAGQGSGAPATGEGQPETAGPEGQDGDQPAADGTDNAGGEADVFADATEAQRAAYQAAVQRAREAEHRYRSDLGRQSALQRRVRELEAQLGQRQPSGEAADRQPADGDQNKPSAQDAGLLADETWRRFQQEYPEVAGPIASAFQALEERNARLEQQLGQVTGRLSQEDLDAQEQALAEAHPDWERVVADPAFARWVEGQPAAVQRIAQENGERIVDGESAAFLVGLFKQQAQAAAPAQPRPAATAGAAQAQVGTPGQGAGAQPAAQPPNSNTAGRRQRRLDAATAVESRGPGAGSGPPDDFDAAFDFFARRASA